jgi:hypothetical protein
MFSYALLKDWEWELGGLLNVMQDHCVSGSEKWFSILIQDGIPLHTICQALRSAGVLYFSALMQGSVESESTMSSTPVADSESALSNDKRRAGEPLGHVAQDATPPTAGELEAKNRAYNEGINDCIIRLANGGISPEAIYQALHSGGGFDYVLFAAEDWVHKLARSNEGKACRSHDFF